MKDPWYQVCIILLYICTRNIYLQVAMIDSFMDCRLYHSSYNVTHLSSLVPTPKYHSFSIAPIYITVFKGKCNRIIVLITLKTLNKKHNQSVGVIKPFEGVECQCDQENSQVFVGMASTRSENLINYHLEKSLELASDVFALFMQQQQL